MTADAIDTTPRATPTGEPDKRDRDAWLLFFAFIALSDIESARQSWIADHAGADPLGIRGVSLGEDGWKWDAQAQLYRGPAGHKLDGHGLKNLSLLYAASAEQDLRKAASDMAMGKTPIDVWQRETAEAVKRLNITQGALASGGFHKVAQFIPVIQGSPDKPPGLAFSIARLQAFAEDVAAGKPRNDTEAEIVARASAYGTASNSTLEAVKTESHKEATDEKGRKLYLYERNILGSEHACHTDDNEIGCSDCSKAGWVPIGSLPLVGTRRCKAFCKCSLEFSLIGNALGTN